MKAILLIFSLGLALGINRGPHSLTLFEGSYSAVGEIDHYIPTINASFLGDYSEIHLDAPTERLFWEQTLIKFWMFSDSNYLIFPDTPDICFTKPVYTLRGLILRAKEVAKEYFSFIVPKLKPVLVKQISGVSGNKH
jgi:hypothetical protein